MLTEHSPHVKRRVPANYGELWNFPQIGPIPDAGAGWEGEDFALAIQIATNCYPLLPGEES